MVRLVAGGWVAGSQPPGSLPLPVVCRTATATWPTLVLTCSDRAWEPRRRVPRDWVTRLSGGTMMPVSEAPSRGPLSVRASTSASAGWLPVFIRYTSRWAAVVLPGPMNQKWVPGARHCRVTRPSGPACSTSRPWAMAPVAWTTTPPRPGLAGTAVFVPVPVPVPADGEEDGAGGAAGTAGAAGTDVRFRKPGVLRVVRVGPGVPAGVSREMTAVPEAGVAGLAAAVPAWEVLARAVLARAVLATLPEVTPPEPGAGQARMAEVTGAPESWPSWMLLPMVTELLI